MANQCTHCGNELPENDAQFCNRCGMPVAAESSRPQPPQEKPVVRFPSLAHLEGKASPRKQIAQQPMGRLPSITPEQSAQRKTLRCDASSPSLFDYPPLPNTFPGPPDDPVPAPSPGLEMHTSTSKNDEQAQPTSPSSHEERPAAIEDMPTSLMPRAPMSESGQAQKEAVARSKPISEAGLDDVGIEDMPTRSMPLTPAQRDVLSDAPAFMTKPPATHIDEIERVDTLMLPVGAKMNTPPVQDISPARPAEVQPLVSGRKLPKRRKTFISVALAVLVVMLIAGIWVARAGEFSVAQVTQPWQPFSDSHLGVALNYPTGWPGGSYDKTGALTLHDSSNTAILTLSKASASGTDATHALQQQANKLALTNVKALDALSFAGVKWQREQGSIQKDGATYTIVLFVGARGDALYTMGLLAAQSVYSEYEQAVFAPMRASLHFL